MAGGNRTHVLAVVDYRRVIAKALASAPMTLSEIMGLVSSPGCSGERADFDEAMKTLLEMSSVRLSMRDGLFRLVESAPNEITEFTVESKHAQRIAKGGTCDRCHLHADVIWRYADTSLGNPRGVCSECKPLVQDKSWGTKDAMDTGRATVSNFEGNSRRH